MSNFYPDIPRIYTAFAEWGVCMIYLGMLREKKKTLNFYILSIGALIVQSLFLVKTEEVHQMLWLPCMFIAVLFMYCFITIGSGVTKAAGIYICSRAFLIAEFVASLEWQIDTYLRWNQNIVLWQKVLLFLTIYSGCFYVVWCLEKKQPTKEYIQQITIKEVLSAIGIVLVVFAFSNLSFIYGNSPFTSTVRAEIFNIRTLADLCGLGILYAHQSRVCEYLAEKEITAIQTVLRSQYDQYRNYQDSLDLIHMKYHDLKHQIAGLRAETDLKRRTDWIDAMEEQVSAMEIMSRTGNQVLDTILAAKIFQCRKNGIQITCVADGKLLNFMHVTDICSIFGNALDNAIESVIMIPEKEKRLIHVSVVSKKGFVFIKVENYCETEVVFTDKKHIHTTKRDKANHGFGLKSICYVAEKYGGSVDFGTVNGWFELKILLPNQRMNS